LHQNSYNFSEIQDTLIREYIYSLIQKTKFTCSTIHREKHTALMFCLR
jgi:hypothetical protein